MRPLLLLTVIGLLAACVCAWSKEDYEIFDLVSAVESSEGKGTTFYSWLDVPPTASVAVINKAYRKKSIQLHPDKNPGIKGIHERFARLGVVATILRNPEGRERYDFFFKNGVPTWRGTGYYYSRFRPGFGTVLTFLVMVSSGFQYLFQRLSFKSDLARIERFTREARLAAWGPRMVPVEGKRKVRVNLSGQMQYDEDGNPLAGKVLECVVEGSGAVSIPDGDGNLIPLNESTATPPAWTRTWFITLAKFIYQKATNKRSTESMLDESATGAVDADSEVDSDGTRTPASESSAATGSAPSKQGRATATTMAGGKRRKVTKRR